MNVETLAAAMNVAFGISSADEMTDQEWEVLKNEMRSFKLNEEQTTMVIDRFKSMEVLEAINILRNADDATRNEAQALALVTMVADGELSDKELGALSLMSSLCKFRKMDLDEAHQIVGF